MKHSNKIILGSQSPRRKELLSNAGFKFEVKAIDVDEVFPQELKASDIAAYLANEKNKAYREIHHEEIIITADTVVISDQKFLGKPENIDEAVKMLSLLSGRVHTVVTGVTISDINNHHTFSSVTEVKVKPLSIKEINHYINQFKPFDKAGSYGIQEWFGLIAIEWINGSFYNVVGLPIDKVYQILVDEFGIEVD